MRIKDLTKSIEIVNDEKLYLIDLDLLHTLESDKEIDGVSLKSETILKSIFGLADFARKHEEFSLAFYRCYIGPTRWIWFFNLIYRINGDWQRVHLENINCEFCDWKGVVANPTEPSLYDTVKDKQKAYDIAWSLAEVKCPTCGKKLKRKAVWAE